MLLQVLFPVALLHFGCANVLDRTLDLYDCSKLGPEYWCVNPVFAEKCDRKNYCQEHVWSKKLKLHQKDSNLPVKEHREIIYINRSPSFKKNVPAQTLKLHQKASNLPAKERREIIYINRSPAFQKNVPAQTLETSIIEDRCSSCKELAGMVSMFIADETSIEELTMLVTQTCIFLPEFLQSYCKEQVDKRLPVLIDLLQNMLSDSDGFCTMMTLCESKPPAYYHRALLIQPSIESVSKNDFSQRRDTQWLDDIICKKCINLANHVEEILKEKPHMVIPDNINMLLHDECNKEKVKELKNVCSILVDKYANIMIQRLLAGAMSPGQICKDIEVCHQEEKSATVNTIPKVASSAIFSNKGFLCEKCLNFVNYVVDRLSEQPTPDEIKGLLHDVCNKEGVPTAMCNTFVGRYADEMIESFLAGKMKPEQICEKIKLCQPEENSKTVIKTPDFTTSSIASNKGFLCEKCLNLVNYVVDRLSDKPTPDEIKGLLHDVCNKEGVQTAMCNTFVGRYADKMIESFLAGKMKPERICEKIKLCQPEENSKTVIKTPDFTTSSIASNKGFLCEKCLNLVNYVVDRLSDKPTPDEIKGLLHDVCNKEGVQTAMCNTFVGRYVDEMIESFLEGKLKPEQICEKIKLCQPEENSQTVIKIPDFTTSSIASKKGLVCDKCLYLVNYVIVHLSEKPTPCEIKGLLRDVCNREATATCNSLVDRYADEMIESFLAGKLTPEQICKKINLCQPEKKSKTIISIPYATTSSIASNKGLMCEKCLDLVNDVAEHLKDKKATPDQIKELLYEACNKQGRFKSMCKRLVYQHADEMMESVLAGKLTPEQICEQIRLCQAEDNSKTAITLPGVNSATYSSKKGLVCEKCLNLVNDVAEHLKDKKSTPEEIKELLYDACNKQGRFKSMCNRLVYKYADEMIENVLAGKLTNEQICQQIHLCQAEDYSKSVATLPEDASATYSSNQGLMCEKCLNLVNEVAERLKDKKATPDQIKELLYEACNKQGRFKSMCKRLVYQHADEMMESVLAGKLTPEQICEQIRLCQAEDNSKTAITLPGVASATYSSNKGLMCEKCLNLVNYVADRLKDRKPTPDEIKALLHEACNNEKGIKAMCNRLVDRYADKMIGSFLAGKLTPEQTCEQVKLCRPEDNSKSAIIILEDASTTYFSNRATRRGE